MTKRKNAHLKREDAPPPPDPRQLELQLPDQVRRELAQLDAVMAAARKHFGATNVEVVCTLTRGKR